jgi:dTDP-glucose 4,6-dehydratase
MSTLKLTAELGWRPEHSFDAGLAETVQWYLDHRTWWERVLSEAYRATNAMYLKD